MTKHEGEKNGTMLGTDGHYLLLYTGGVAIAAPLTVLLIFSLPMAGKREELYSLKGATVPYRYAILTFSCC